MRRLDASSALRFALLFSIAACAGPPRRDVFPAIAGRWGWTGDHSRSCAVNPHTLVFSADRQFMTLRHEAPVAAFDGTKRREGRYRVLKSTADSVTLELEGETRRQRDGRTVVWELHLLSDTAYCWHRTDKPGRTCGHRVVRCR